ncbi:MAG: hypothetical protein KBS81_04925 [Spirochaetales bacterium]|nr:hypothetical protein [Candidatus Physcosoma equi]
MVSRKYTSDYRLENVTDKKGRLVTVPVYRGDVFSFERPEDEMKKIKKVFAVSMVLQVVLFLIPLFLNSQSARTIYVSLPYLAMAFPLLGEVDAVFTFLFLKKDVKRSEKDKVTEKLVSWVFLVLLFGIFSTLGHIVHWMLDGETVADAIHLVITIVIVALGYSLFSRRKLLSMKRTGSTKMPESYYEN